MRYDYNESIKSDVRDWMNDHKGELEGLDRSDAYEVVYDSCWVDDSVTGNASGSYTFNRMEARENLFNDSDSDEYLGSMVEEGFITNEEIGKAICSSNWEYLDVCIRCYLLGSAVSSVLDEVYVD